MTRLHEIIASAAALRKTSARYQGDPINRAALLEARANYIALIRQLPPVQIDALARGEVTP